MITLVLYDHIFLTW